MKAVFQRESLRDAVNLVSGAVAGTDVKPVLQHMKVSIDDSRCTLEATNLELGIRTELRGIKAEMFGQALIPVNRFSAILREASGDDVTVEADDEKARVFAGFAEFEMATANVSEFPDFTGFKDAGHFAMKAGDVKLMINRTQFAAASENPRYAMNGVLFEFEKGVARFIATDGRRLAVCKASAISAGAKDTTAGATHVVPRAAVTLLTKTLTEPNEEVRIQLTPNDILFRTERTTIYSRLVEGRYPAWREVIPKKTTTQLKVSAGAIHAAVRQAAIMADDESKAVKWSVAKGTVRMQSRSSATGQSKVDLRVEQDGKDMQISFDPAFLNAMFRVVDSDQALTIDLQEATPAIFRAGDDYQYVVMPLA